MTRPTTPEYTNGRIRVRPEQIEYLENLLHKTWVELSQIRAGVKEATQPAGTSNALVTHMNRELRLITSIQEEVKRTREEMESR